MRVVNCYDGCPIREKETRLAHFDKYFQLKYFLSLIMIHTIILTLVYNYLKILWKNI